MASGGKYSQRKRLFATRFVTNDETVRKLDGESTPPEVGTGMVMCRELRNDRGTAWCRGSAGCLRRRSPQGEGVDVDAGGKVKSVGLRIVPGFARWPETRLAGR